jgi:hypothetical protein
MTEQEYKLHQGVKVWNIVASVFFVGLCLFMYFVFVSLRPDFSLQQIVYFDLFILALATHRLIRLFIYDNITLFIREAFQDLEVQDELYKYVNSENAFKLTVHKLLNCPWCLGVWIAFVSAFFYFTFPVLQFVFIILAFASVASLLILLTNLLGWSAEEKKLKVQKM